MLEDMRDSFKNWFAVIIIVLCFGQMYLDKSSRPEMLIILTLIVKHYYDSSRESAKKDEAIASMANSIPDAEKKK